MKRINFLFLLIFEHGAERSHSEACSLKKRTLIYSIFVFTECLISHFGNKKERLENQRTNGPANAHLRPEIYTNKLV